MLRNMRWPRQFRIPVHFRCHFKCTCTPVLSCIDVPGILNVKETLRFLCNCNSGIGLAYAVQLMMMVWIACTWPAELGALLCTVSLCVLQ